MSEGTEMDQQTPGTASTQPPLLLEEDIDTACAMDATVMPEVFRGVYTELAETNVNHGNPWMYFVCTVPLVFWSLCNSAVRITPTWKPVTMISIEIVGPPGTGKSTMIKEATRTFAKARRVIKIANGLKRLPNSFDMDAAHITFELSDVPINMLALEFRNQNNHALKFMDELGQFWEKAKDRAHASQYCSLIDCLPLTLPSTRQSSQIESEPLSQLEYSRFAMFGATTTKSKVNYTSKAPIVDSGLLYRFHTYLLDPKAFLPFNMDTARKTYPQNIIPLMISTIYLLFRDTLVPGGEQFEFRIQEGAAFEKLVFDIQQKEGILRDTKNYSEHYRELASKHKQSLAVYSVAVHVVTCFFQLCAQRFNIVEGDPTEKGFWGDIDLWDNAQLARKAIELAKHMSSPTMRNRLSEVSLESLNGAATLVNATTNSMLHLLSLSNCSTGYKPKSSESVAAKNLSGKKVKAKARKYVPSPLQPTRSFDQAGEGKLAISKRTCRSVKTLDYAEDGDSE
ncbi:hypothetical protein BCR33DRAFT_784344 [Rhizoclosmatium globosum]|uniref:Uncharacterized protein n=1 Tax=Rhizoclosmatium globosum TaxID=329046 RepID=A0A1Y2CEW1_9FUNG|nr:hypothetical protein BCR33DRAFT_784344 [Rhizoclosmatium globosum]|eukprot:ORY45579.1 hypothetical protein BCR33DRAFT_784344 [Rhizoclosmatium globosum]